MWVDIGVNLTATQFAADRDEVVARARAAGVERMLLTGTSLPDSAEVLQLAEQYQLHATVGVHPHHASEWQADSDAQLRRLAAHQRASAIGECGLDFNRNFSTPAAQELAFSAQLTIATALAKPVFLHCRDAHERFMLLLRPHLSGLPAAVLHCFTGTQHELRECLAHGLYIGITGWVCDERRGQPLLALLPEIPLDRLLLETDAPWLLPRDLRPAPKSRRNEPAFLPHVAARVAAALGMPLDELAQRTRANAERVFGLR